MAGVCVQAVSKLDREDSVRDSIPEPDYDRFEAVFRTLFVAKSVQLIRTSFSDA
jgi:hypothetical protein